MNKTQESDQALLDQASSYAIGKSLRKTHPLSAHGVIKARPKDFDSNAILEKSTES